MTMSRPEARTYKSLCAWGKALFNDSGTGSPTSVWACVCCSARHPAQGLVLHHSLLETSVPSCVTAQSPQVTMPGPLPGQGSFYGPQTFTKKWTYLCDSLTQPSGPLLNFFIKTTIG